MPLADDLNRYRDEGVARFAAAATAEAVEAARIALLGASGSEKELTKAFAAGSIDDKKSLGRAFNEVKQTVRDAFTAAQARVAAIEDDAPIDPTEPRPARRKGSLHPVSQAQREVEQVFTSMGYEIVDGPHVELDDYNFTRLNLPADHPARDHQDTFWLSNPNWAAGAAKLLRTHTSAVQSRIYPAATPPLRKVVVGKVFRYEAVDATHDNTFTQVEGFAIDRDLNCQHLVGTIHTMLRALLKRDDVEVRLRPSFFPFVEPGFEVDVRLTSAEPGSRFARWVELLGCGMIHPNVLAAGGIDATKWQGFAFGLGLERVVMLRHGIADIRVMHGADVRSLHQLSLIHI
jgi:phenylalanyl-tRNA synthetase alpha chain